MRCCKDCKHYESPNACYCHNKEDIDPVTGDRHLIYDPASIMRSNELRAYFWFWNNCGVGGRLWEKRDSNE